MKINKVVVVGAGPAGMMAAIRAAQLSQDVTLLEKNPDPGRKLLLSGKGRCNLTNACEPGMFLERFSRGGEFLRDAFQKFSNLDLINFFETRGAKLKIERQSRVFPESDSSKSVLDVLLKELRQGKVKLFFKASLREITLKDGKVNSLVLADGKVVEADKVILAMGGLSYTYTGSTGDGIKLAEKFGHRIVALRPGLVPLQVKQEDVARSLEGLTLKNIKLKFCAAKKKITTEVGEMLFTHSGISGPLVISHSGAVIDWMVSGQNAFVSVDLKPGLSEEELNSRILRDFKAYPARGIKNVLKGLLPLRFADVFVKVLKIDPEKKVSLITRPERLSIARSLKDFRLDISGSLPVEHAMVTRGGVSLKDINPRTMESRLIKGLYFAGEMIDVDADTGGFNLQAAFSTGYLAGESAALN